MLVVGVDATENEVDAEVGNDYAEEGECGVEEEGARVGADLQ